MSEPQNVPGIVADVRSFIEDHIHPEIVTIVDPTSGVEALVEVVNDSVRTIDASVFNSYRTKPARRRGTAELTSLDSMITHVNRFKDDNSVLFACDDRTKPSIKAVLNYHCAGAIDAADPRFGDHVSMFRFPLSDEWKAWAATDGKPLGMAEFAAFLEDRIIDVLDLIPGEDSLSEELQRFINTVGGTIASPSKLIELSVGLKVNEASVVKEAINLASGEAQVQFVSEHRDDQGQPLKVPGLFMIGIPVFAQGPIYRIAARLRYRKTPAGLVFFYQLWRADRTFDHAFREGCERARVETDLPLLFGQPE